MRVRACTDQQVMALGIVAIRRNLGRRMQWIIDFQAIDRNFLAKLIQQISIKGHKSVLPARVGDEAHRAALVSRIHHGGGVICRKCAACL